MTLARLALPDLPALRTLPYPGLHILVALPITANLALPATMPLHQTALPCLLVVFRIY